MNESPSQTVAPRSVVRTRRARAAHSLLAQAEPMLWLTGGALVVCVLMIVGLLGWVFYQGVGTLWPGPVVQVTSLSGDRVMGEVTRREWYRPGDNVFATMEPAMASQARQMVEANGGQSLRRLFRTGNFDLTGEHFNWVSDFVIDEETTPTWVLVVERQRWGRFYGVPVAFMIDGERVAEGEAEAWAMFNEHHDAVLTLWHEQRDIEKHDLGRLSKRENEARLAMRAVQLAHGDESPQGRAAAERFQEVVVQLNREREPYQQRLAEIVQETARYELLMRTADGVDKALPVVEIVRAYPANQLNLVGKVGVYLSRWWEFLTDDPREANSEGGVLPAIVGTVVMTLIMSIVVVPFGVLAALYLREYARAGPIVSAVRIAVNNLAGVPSIVFGVFGLGFFVYGVGGYIDRGPTTTLPPFAWMAGLAATVVALIGAMVLSIRNARSAASRQRSPFMRVLGGTLWLGAVAGLLVLLATTPYFDGFFPTRTVEAGPTFGKGGLLWASLTLALLTLPVVIVATEEALAAVPHSMREGSYACGASKWQTIARIVLPRAMPGIMTGAILAMARGAGEVAPLMLVGAVKLAPELPVDGAFPYLHPERSFMHLGFHIFDLGFQSQNSEAAKPMVYTTTLLLILIIALLNLSATWLRARLRRRFVGSQF